MKQMEMDLGLPEMAEKDTSKQDKARARAVENEEFKDKRQPKSDLIRQTELEKMKETLNMPRSGGGASPGVGKMNRDITKTYKTGGKIRGHGCEQRGRTKGRMV